ncbi:MAG: hypothetical protein ACK53Y_23895, partial [bacterium]
VSTSQCRGNERQNSYVSRTSDFLEKGGQLIMQIHIFISQQQSPLLLKNKNEAQRVTPLLTIAHQILYYVQLKFGAR